MEIVAVPQEIERSLGIRKALSGVSEPFWERIVSAKSILVSPQLSHHLDYSGSTHIDDLREVLKAVRDRSKALVILAGASPSSTPSAFRDFGYTHLLEEFAPLKLVDVNEDDVFLPEQNPSDVCLSKTMCQSDVRIFLAFEHTDESLVRGWIPEPMFRPDGRYWARQSCSEQVKQQAQASCAPHLVILAQHR